MKKVLCFGEFLLRISPAADNQTAEKNPMQLYMGGAEANVATALAGWNVPTKYCTVLPDNFMSSHVIDYLEYKGIYTSSIIYAGNRIGIYYLEKGADLKGKMVYDRDNSAFSQVKLGMIDWEKVFRDVDWFNLSAISPALNQNVADVCLEAVEVASKMGITISLDLNHRARLWKYGKDPLEIMPQIAQHCTVLMGNIWSANSLLGIPVDEHIHSYKSREAYLQHAKETSLAIIKKFPKCNTVANTFRFDSNQEDITYYTSLYTDKEQYSSEVFSCKGVVDRSGSGDCYMAGLIYGKYNGLPPQEIVDFATSAAFGKLQELGDSTEQNVFRVKKMM